MKKGAIIITLIVTGMVLGFGGWITSESAAVKTIAGANTWIWVAGIGAVSTLAGFILLAIGWGKNEK